MKALLKNSWKALAVILVVYAALASFFVPMSPGIYEVDKQWNQDSVLVLNVTGYNSNFTLSENTLWLENQNQNIILPFDIAATDNLHIKVSFHKADFPSSGSYNLWLHNSTDKTLFIREALFFAEQKLAFEGNSTLDFNRKQFIEAKEGFNIPFKSILYETIRNLNFHVCMWFVLLALMTISLIYSIRYLNKGNLQDDVMAAEAAKVGLYFAILGIITGSIWAKNTWGAYWVSDPKLNGAALTTLVYAAYLVLRQSLPDAEKKARLSSVYNVFAYVLMIVFIQVLPRLTDSLHPGNGGNPAFSQYDLDNNLRMIFYPATLGWILVGIWIWNLQSRTAKLMLKNEEI